MAKLYGYFIGSTIVKHVTADGANEPSEIVIGIPLGGLGY